MSEQAENEAVRVPLVGLGRSELEALLAGLGEPAFRARQVGEWVYRRGAASFGEMTNLSLALREELAQRCLVRSGEVVGERASADGCRKLLLQFPDACRVETVLLPYAGRTACCVSTQVGCPVGCPFCATGLSGYTRNLTAGEIVEQVLAAQRIADCGVQIADLKVGEQRSAGKREIRDPRSGIQRPKPGIRNPKSAIPNLKSEIPLTHVIFMGMGEPLLNYANVLKAVRLLNEEVGIGMRRLTISTVGVVPAMDRLAAEALQLTLAVSLQAPEAGLRARLVPLARRYPLTELMAACRRYVSRTRRRLTFEYVLLRGINDSVAQARAVCSLLKPLTAAVNLIPYNPVPGAAGFDRSEPSQVSAFRGVLEGAGITVTERVERGGDIAGACGQLRARRAEEDPEPDRGKPIPEEEPCHP
ncbi:MAG: 23S rRNA (adenine(2503)-C(2))-methyltransferase RlmN [Armatimonadetes bacterium CG_4_10_14_3_um_filter_66_18]|nr:23S rRNA (adenine(2503)-C(2))-methyltransferase RlmN [Armatimonadota bacterium]OIO99612.1 MAG: hypothetical protein AUJ96_19320 [Armatimonadetes bacterium CG2_30_66_41]PIU92772.1 MAG: 23S rRNA (adenine(2503)-C(2))-methyltransferase RlmN [Armatimonadetes bacterium CG06_land_8_20_14_3_00_66_21]PIX38779.1 MAG: 23S rRNA (adenine(2503)-C(2))-methyltransferase RlmN [Armatimonadetes bacterium CG_4_8_14_3_um_filter_66_20]PIY47406.1 MAG: 23S rRNA (adenine(2503)-C(2))-methyltransferase RlmN [Armatimon